MNLNYFLKKINWEWENIYSRYMILIYLYNMIFLKKNFNANILTLNKMSNFWI
jgi:hypothetical protein